jgi:hypothetical protein
MEHLLRGVHDLPIFDHLGVVANYLRVIVDVLTCLVEQRGAILLNTQVIRDRIILNRI